MRTMSKQNAITCTQITLPAITGISLSDSVKSESQSLLRLSAGLLFVESQEDVDSAQEIAGKLRKFENEIEKARKQQVGPLNDVVNRINQLAKDATGEVSGERSRIENEVGSFIQKKNKEARIAREAQLRLIEQHEVERRKEADARAQLGLPQEPLPVEKEILVPVVIPTEGLGARNDFDYEVTDLHALYQAYPSLVRLEVNASALRRTIEQNGTDVIIPGVVIKARTKITIKASK